MRKSKNRKQEKAEQTVKQKAIKEAKKTRRIEVEENIRKWSNLPEEEWTEERKKYLVTEQLESGPE